MPVTSWSHSRAGDFEKCKKMFWLKYDQKIPEPERPLPPGKSEHANDRGTRIHDSCEHYVNGSSDDLCWEAEKHFGPQLDLMRVLHKQGMVSLEGEWAMDKAWATAEWRIGWLRLKLDAIVHLSPTEAIVIDYKSGKKFGNEIKHGEQLQLYALVSFLRYPKLEKVTAELWYIDQNEVTTLVFRRDQALRFKEKWDSRGNKITSCKDFPPNPNVFSCRWCPYGPPDAERPHRTGDCLVGK